MSYYDTHESLTNPVDFSDDDLYCADTVDYDLETDGPVTPSSNSSLARAESPHTFQVQTIAQTPSLPATSGARVKKLATTDFPCLMKPFALNSQGIPTNWSFLTEDSKHYNLNTLAANDFEYQIIQSEMKKADLDVTTIERIENRILLDTYKHQMTHLCTHRHPGYELNERYLYHGTAASREQICEEGLDMRLSRVGRFGRGIYFSDNPLKCINYLKAQDSSKDMYILKCRVLLGDTKVYAPGESDTKLKREPLKEAPGDRWKYYDSVKGAPKDYNEFVVYQNSRVLVEYLISFEKPDFIHHSSEVQDFMENVPSDVRERPRANSCSSTEGSVNDQRSRANSVSSQASVENPRSRASSISSQRSFNAIDDSTSLIPKGGADVVDVVDDGAGIVSKDYSPVMQPLEMDAVAESQTQESFNAEDLCKLIQLKTLVEEKELSAQKKSELTAAFERTYGAAIREKTPASSTEEYYYCNQVLYSLIGDFMTVTKVEDENIAKRYLEKTHMNLDEAIFMFYEDMD